MGGFAYAVIRAALIQPTRNYEPDPRMKAPVRDWSLNTGRWGGGGGGVQKGRGGGHVKFYRQKKGGGAEKVLAMLKGGHNKFWDSLYVVAIL